MLKRKLLISTGIHTLLNIIGSLLPLLLALFLSWMFEKHPINHIKLTGKGEIVLMCIPMCIGVLFTLYHYKKEKGINKLSHVFFIVNFVILVVSVCIYAYSIKGLNNTNTKLLYFSYFLLAWTAIMIFVAKYIEDESIESLSSSRKEDEIGLEKKFTNS